MTFFLNGRYSVDNIPLYDSEDDEPTSKIFQAIVPKDDTTPQGDNAGFMTTTNGHDAMMCSESNPIDVVPLNSVPMGMDGGKFGGESNGFFHVTQKKFEQKSSLVTRIRSNSACRNYKVQSNSLPKSSPLYSSGRSKIYARKQVDVKHIERFLSKEAYDEVLAYEVQTRLNFAYEAQIQLKLLLYVGVVSFTYKMTLDKFSKILQCYSEFGIFSHLLFLNQLLQKSLN